MKDQQLACNRCAVRTAGIISAEDKKKDRCAQNKLLKLSVIPKHNEIHNKSSETNTI